MVRSFSSVFISPLLSQLCLWTVAVTRAKALLIVIGNPTVLSLDPLWRGFLNYVHLNGGWTGQSDISWDPHEPLREGGYDAEVRARALAELDEQLAKFNIAPMEASADEEGEGANEDLDNLDRQE
jgi:helicase MOV-10